MQGLRGKVAIVTGASRGIGLAVAQRLVDEGARVTVTARKEYVLAEAVEGLGGEEHALGIAGTTGTALRLTRAGELSMWKGCAFAHAARNGVFAALLTP